MTILIIGGGLSGLALADRLEAQGAEYLLVEGRDRLGGRILTAVQEGRHFDLGPAWFWPGQPRLDGLVQRFGLGRFYQYASGDLLFEDGLGQVTRGRGFASMAGSWRLDGGMAALVQALAAGLPPRRVRLNAQVVGLSRDAKGLTAHLHEGAAIPCDQVVLALPPRLVATMRFAPALPAAAVAALQAVPTWMAGQAKAVAVYDRPFWRAAGLSGDVTSRSGPMVEVHDASPVAGGPYALFGFIGVPPRARQDAGQLRDQIVAQLVRLFGAAAAQPAELFVKDWATDPFSATPADQDPLMAHPHYGLPAVLAQVWDGRIVFAGSEVAAEFGGYLEGALEAAEAALRQLEFARRKAGP